MNKSLKKKTVDFKIERNIAHNVLLSGELNFAQMTFGCFKRKMWIILDETQHALLLYLEAVA